MNKIETMVMIQKVSPNHYRIYVAPGDYWVVRAHFAEDAIKLFESFSVYKIKESWIIPRKKY